MKNAVVESTQASCLRGVTSMFSFLRRNQAKPRHLVLHGETERETDGRWIAEVTDLPGVLAYGSTEAEAVNRAMILALRVLADRMEHGEVAASERGMSVELDLQPA